MKKIWVLLLLTIPLLIQAATFCVETSQEFTTALQTAGGNGENDIIKLKTGEYFNINHIPFVYSYTENKDLEISGGWHDFNGFGCILQSSSPFNTILDADGQSIVLLFTYNNNYPHLNFKISNLSIINGYSEQNVGSGLQMALPNNHSGEVLIDRVYFGNNYNTVNGALTITWPQTVTIRNSVFQSNHTGQGDGVIQINLRDGNNGLYFVNNSVINSSHDVLMPDTNTISGLRINIQSIDVNGYPRAFVANNLFWSAYEHDIYFPTIGTSYSYNNNFQSVTGGHATYAGNNSTANPDLASGSLDFTPNPGSPLIDAGLSETIESTLLFEDNWSYGDQDFYGSVRVINGQVDIGAVEAPPEIPIFKNGFELQNN